MSNKSFFSLGILFLTLFLGAGNIFAQVPDRVGDCKPSCVQDYLPLTGIPGVTQGVGAQKAGTDADLSDFFSNMFNLGVGIAGILAVIMLMWGGIEYMTSEAVGNKENAKSRITSAIIGLLIVLMSWLILYTINPDILRLNLNPQSSGTGTGAGAGSNSNTPNLSGGNQNVNAPIITPSGNFFNPTIPNP